MKKAIRILSLILAFSMIMMCFTGCELLEKEDREIIDLDDNGKDEDNDKKLCKTCEKNIDIIKANAVNYLACYNEFPTIEDIALMFDNNQLPECPLSEDGDHTNDYDLFMNDFYSSPVVICKNGHTRVGDSNSKVKTCANNRKTMKSNSVAYYASYGYPMSSTEDMARMFDNGQLPECPLSEDGNHRNDYYIQFNSDGSATVICANGHA